MPTLVNKYQLEDLAHKESKSEIFLSTKLKTVLHIDTQSDRTIISLPLDNKFDLVDGMIIIHENNNNNNNLKTIK